MADTADFQTIFDQLKPILQAYESNLVVTADAPGNYYLDTKMIGPNKKPIFFGAVQIKKNYVSFHFMPVYMNPALLGSMSPQLKKRMQGKACFNFSKPDAALFDELKALTQQGVEWSRQHPFT